MSEELKSAAPAPAPAKVHAPTLYFIAGFKLLKALLFVTFAIVVIALSNKNLSDIFDNIIRFLHLDPETRFFASISDRLGEVTPANVRKFASVPLIYGFFLLASGIGLALRAKWAIWLAIGESAFFIPIEIYEIVRPHNSESAPHHTMTLAAILAVNILIVWYLYRNRDRLFRHHG
jgi:uncharacterized membrane protein (DUF2068 family)